MSGKGDFCKGEEDIDVASFIGLWVGDVVDEDGFGEVEFSRDGLFLVLCWRRGETGRDGYDGEGVAAVWGGGEDVEGDEGEFGRHDDLGYWWWCK